MPLLSLTPNPGGRVRSLSIVLCVVRSAVKSYRCCPMMKRFLPCFSAAILSFLLFASSWAQCPEDPNDLGICDTVYVETFDCDNEYEAEPGSFDSVRVAIYVTHDSNTFYSDYHGMYVQDSIEIFVIPLTFWHQPQGCADSVILPWWDHWNNVALHPYDLRMPRSIFRDIVDTHTGDTVYNRMYALAKEDPNLAWSTIHFEIEGHSCEGDSGHVWLALLASYPTNRCWWEGSRELLATLTFHVYMSEDCDTTEIGLDSIFWPPQNRLAFFRYDQVSYFPRHFLPVNDTIYIVPHICGDCNGDGVIDVGDVVCLIGYLYTGASGPQPLCIGDVDCNSEVDNGDLIYLINYLFLGTSPPCSECCSQ
jgi:hypothetical protein